MATQNGGGEEAQAEEEGTESFGRPTLCTPERTAEVCKWLASGCYIETACSLAGISDSVYFLWKKKGKTGEQPYLDFVESIQRAENQAEARAVALINKAGEEDPKALQWWLSHRHSERWADRSKVDHGGQADNPVVTQIVIGTRPAADPADVLSRIEAEGGTGEADGA